MSYAKKKMAMQIDEKSLAYPFFPQMAGDPGDRKDMDLVMNSKCFHLRLCGLYETLVEVKSMDFSVQFH